MVRVHPGVLCKDCSTKVYGDIVNPSLLYIILQKGLKRVPWDIFLTINGCGFWQSNATLLLDEKLETAGSKFFYVTLLKLSDYHSEITSINL